MTSLADGDALGQVHVRQVEVRGAGGVQDQQHCSYVSNPEELFQQHGEDVNVRRCLRECRSAQHAYACSLATPCLQIEAAHEESYHLSDSYAMESVAV
jgi:hypothetical protein